MKRCLTVMACLLFAVAMGAGAAFASDDPEWDTTVAALAQLDPPIAPPVQEPGTVVAAGAGNIQHGLYFGFGARSGPMGAAGSMVMTSGEPPEVFRATVTCVAATLLPDGSATATIIGRLDSPAFGVFPTLVFIVIDSGLPGGLGDQWTGEFTPLQPSEFACVPMEAIGPLTEGNIIIRFLPPGSRGP